jgi:hypothetical protein
MFYVGMMRMSRIILKKENSPPATNRLVESIFPLPQFAAIAGGSW